MYIRTYACLCVCVCVRESVCSQPVSNDTGNYTVTWSHKVQTFDSKLSFYTCNRCQDFQSCMLCLWPMSGFRETERAAVTHENCASFFVDPQEPFRYQGLGLQSLGFAVLLPPRGRAWPSQLKPRTFFLGKPLFVGRCLLLGSGRVLGFWVVLLDMAYWDAR